MRGSEVVYLTGEELSINAHQPIQPNKRPSHNQYQNPDNVLPPPFGSLLLASPNAGLLPVLGLNLTETAAYRRVVDGGIGVH